MLKLKGPGHFIPSPLILKSIQQPDKQIRIFDTITTKNITVGTEIGRSQFIYAKI